MKSTWLAIVRGWVGIAAAAVVLVSGASLLVVHVQEVRATPGDKALVDSLKARAHTDVTIHAKLLQPEFDRQRLALERRLKIYRGGGLLLLCSLAFFLAWIKWLKPARGAWLGVPRWLVTQVEAASPPRDVVVRTAVTRPRRKARKIDAATLPLKGLSRAQKARFHFRILDTCSGCTLCAQACPPGAIEARPYQRHEVIDGRCTRCGLCVPACPEHAIEVTSEAAEGSSGGPKRDGTSTEKGLEELGR